MKTKSLIFFIALTLFLSLCNLADAQRPELPQSLLNKLDNLLKPDTNYPSLEQMKKGLIGRKLTEQPNGYFGKDWYWQVGEGEIKSIKVTEETKHKTEYACVVNVILQRQGSPYEANVKMSWALSNKKWSLDFVECLGIGVVRSGKYNNAITIERKGHSGEYYLEIRNRSDISLLIGGQVFMQYGSNWQKFSKIVDGCTTVTIGGLFVGSVQDWTLDFIERP